MSDIQQTITPPTSFETARLRLRAMEVADAAVMFATYTGERQATQYMSFPCATSPADSLPFVHMVEDSFAGRRGSALSFAWLIFLKESGECIGSCGIGPKSEHCWSGGYILATKHWRQGFAAEAWKPVVDWARQQPDIHRIEATHHPDNPASGKVMEYCGLSFEARLPNHSVYPNISHEKLDAVMYAWVRGKN